MNLESVATGPSSSPVDNIVSLGQGRKVAPRSLVISPNLDALLEHEERKRAQNSNNASGAEPGTPESFQQLVSPQQSGPAGEYPGLPPPPRRVKGPKSPLSPMTGPPPWGAEERIETTTTASSSLSNPYINPAPTLDEVLLSGMGVESGNGRDGSEKVTRTLPWSPNDGSNSRQQSHPTQNIAEHVASLDLPSSSLTSQIIIAGPRSGAKLVNKSKPQDMRQADIGNAEPYALGRSPDDPSSVVNTPWRRRPLISHGQQSSISSMDSTDTSSTRPASTEENGPRLSISSTIYPGSSDNSHQHSLFNERTSYDMTRNSFMEIYSPANPAFNFGQNSPTDTTSEPLSPINFAASPVSENSFASYPIDTKPTHASKPPVPTTPKPIFSRQILKSRQTSPRSSPPPLTLYEQSPTESRLPPTTNFLDVDERADLVRKHRKLARVFGQTPRADAIAQQDTGHNSTDPSSKSRRRGAAAFNLDGLRRHSMPLSPDDVSFLSIVSPTLEGYPASRTKSKIGSAVHSGKSNDLHSHQATSQIKSSSRTSFIDLSDDEKEAPAPSSEPLEKNSTPDSPPQSLLETMSLEEQPDDERKRKRERLAKLHRFLGSRVPANLVLGIEDLEASLPAASMAPSAYRGSSSENDENSRKAWMKRRRSNSSSTSSRPEELERVKEELDDKEKAINVRRAQKMEKVFGVAPPLTLYHTRHCPSPSALAPPKSLPPLPVPVGVLSDPALPTSWNLNSNRATYIKPKTKKNHRPGTSESNKQLLPKGIDGFEDYAIHPNVRHSLIYNHYQHSLNSLNDILDRDDRESLAELHDYLNNADAPTPKADEDFSTRLDRRASIASTIKSERRRSLPARTSMISLAGSEYSITTPKAEITTFQLRRRRAAKLTQFFGVNYRELINDVLESIENGVDHEQRRGTLRAEEVEDLRSKLRNLKTKRQGLF
ncbi:hypothetical protein CVT25_014811 [Psilocybe cyanescens]|uniref:Uncharacterized protein n=1 Tax=Psilocybe cyanescens TaxID=93625 RepID=A0A409WEQ7_PSICY|nr:hypothetical protein CVT25_014811 [Psilocybe cyanescens]